MSLDVRPLTGDDLDRLLPDVARLRMEVFREWPYLYDGCFDYEHRYLQSYRDSAGAVLIGAFDGADMVGASTGTPMEDHAEDFAAAFAGRDEALSEIFYCAESVLKPAYRGRGIGHAFFDLREAHAAELGRRYSAFCAVVRPPDHPRRDASYRSHDPFWRGRGYAPLPGVVAHFGWKDLDQPRETEKPLQFWMKAL